MTTKRLFRGVLHTGPESEIVYDSLDLPFLKKGYGFYEVISTDGFYIVVKEGIVNLKCKDGKRLFKDSDEISIIDINRVKLNFVFKDMSQLILPGTNYQVKVTDLTVEVGDKILSGSIIKIPAYQIVPNNFITDFVEILLPR